MGAEVGCGRAPDYFSLMSSQPRPPLRIAQVAAALGVSEATARRWFASGDLQGLKVGGLLLVDRDSFEQLLGRMRGASPGAIATMQVTDLPTMEAGAPLGDLDES